jgi:5-methyltetrahydropteroyltriglutamate--homocysteine methyltransferase
MKRSADRILVTHVGSLVRPPAIREVMAAREQDLPYDEAVFGKTLRQEVANVVREQAQAGVDIVSDGEYGKPAGSGMWPNVWAASSIARSSRASENSIRFI